MLRRSSLLGALLTFALAGNAAAQASPDFTLNRFRAGETPDDGFAISGPADMGHLNFGVQLHVDYTNDPLVAERMSGDPTTEFARIVEHQLTAHLGLSLGLFDRIVVFIGGQAVLLMTGDEPEQADQLQATGGGIGDLSFGARIRLFGERTDTFALALQLTGTAPLAGGEFRGDNFLTFHPELLFEVRASPLRVSFNVGGRVRDNQLLEGAVVGDELTFATGIALSLVGDYERPWDTRLDLHGQIFGETPFAAFFGREETSVEILAGLKLHHSSGFTAGIAGGLGMTRGIGSPDVRIIANLGWGMLPDAPEHASAPGDRDGDGILDDEDECPDEPEDIDQFEDANGCPDPDNDEDGILDTDDECPLQPEDRDGFDDQDGCPDPDNDQDGFQDNVDNCPDEPEDRDDFNDDDGCPDPDNDQDGVPDINDRCPNEPGPMENQGCPNPDRDGDGVLNEVDNCPDEPGPASNQGCRERQRVRITGDSIEILEKVYFRTNSDVIERRSYALLNNIVSVLNNHSEIQLVRVEGHTDDRGSDEHNMNLSQRRAESVVRYLTENGVDASRLRAQGFGETRPVVDNNSRRNRATNRRVEFNIGNASGIEQQDNGPGADTIDT